MKALSPCCEKGQLCVRLILLRPVDFQLNPWFSAVGVKQSRIYRVQISHNLIRTDAESSSGLQSPIYGNHAAVASVF